MSYWFISGSLQSTEDGDASFYYPAGGVPSLARALSRDHLREWVKHVSAEKPPEKVDEETDRLWKMLSDLRIEDYVLVQQDAESFALGEVTGVYRFMPDENGGRHAWPVRWVAQNIPFSEYAQLRTLAGARIMKEVSSEEARVRLLKYLPSLRTKSYVIFRWALTAILVAELFYFWPH